MTHRKQAYFAQMYVVCACLFFSTNTRTSLMLHNLSDLGPVDNICKLVDTHFTLKHGCYAGSAQPEGAHSLAPVVDIQLILQHLFPLKSEADVSAAIKAVSSDRQIAISALMPVYRSECVLACLLASCLLACCI